MDVKVYIAIISVILTLVGYGFYFRDIFTGKTKPHAYSWLVWALLTAVAFFGQIADNAGPGAWITAVTAIVSFFIVALGFQRGEKDITKSDKSSLIAVVFTMMLWAITNNPLYSIILVTIIDFLGFLPTIRKSILKPFEETLVHYIFAGAKFALAMFALDNFSVITALYPLSLVLANWMFVILLVVQRKKLRRKSHI